MRAIRWAEPAAAALRSGHAHPQHRLSLNIGTRPLPCAPQVWCKVAGAPKTVLEVGAEALPAALEWGEVLLSVRYAPINPADL